MEVNPNLELRSILGRLLKLLKASHEPHLSSGKFSSYIPSLDAKTNLTK